MKDNPNLYHPKAFWIDIKGNPGEYPMGYHEFYSSFDFEKFLDGVDLSKYKFRAGVR